MVLLLKNVNETTSGNRNMSLTNAVVQLPVIIKKHPKRRNRTVRFNEDNRIMSKSGRINVYLSKIPHKSIRYVRDLWNTLVNMRWRWIMLTVALVNVFAYLMFSAFFLLDAWASGDFDDEDAIHTCIIGANNYTSFLMLGIETITTTGYGYLHPTERCQLVFIVLTCSTLVTIFIDGAFISVVYVKVSRPTYTVSAGVFSKKAVISLRNGRLCLIFRINDKTGKHWINSQVKLFLVKEHISKEGELLPNYVVQLKLNPCRTLLWPVEIVHEINKNSPLWDHSARDLMVTKFELLAIIVGSSILTGQLSKSQTSYLSKEILWGYWFSPCLEFNSDKGQYVVNQKNFQKTVLRDTPLCSAHHLKDVEKEIRNKRRLSLDYAYLSSD